jgi:hypothetical protein
VGDRAVTVLSDGKAAAPAIGVVVRAGREAVVIRTVDRIFTRM